MYRFNPFRLSFVFLSVLLYLSSIHSKVCQRQSTDTYWSVFITDHLSGNFGSRIMRRIYKYNSGIRMRMPTSINTKSPWPVRQFSTALLGMPVPKCQLDIDFSLAPFRWERSGTAIKRTWPRQGRLHGCARSSLGVRQTGYGMG